MNNPASYWREDDKVWLAKLRAYAATLPQKMFDRTDDAMAEAVADADYSRAH
jgi:hypothetical protein